jgi:hypothetical protein
VLINEERTFLWLWRGDLKAKTESEIIAAKVLKETANADYVNNMTRQ